MTTLLAVVIASTLTQAPKESPVEKIEAKAAAALVEKHEATLVDVREQDEVNAGMAKPAQWFPMSKMKDPAALKDFLAKLPKGKVIFYCAVGGRAGRVAEQAKALGYDVANMGGFRDWQAAGLATKDKP
jgi:rhodanese-related sulfurtransferase